MPITHRTAPREGEGRRRKEKNALKGMEKVEESENKKREKCPTGCALWPRCYNYLTSVTPGRREEVGLKEEKEEEEKRKHFVTTKWEPLCHHYTTGHHVRDRENQEPGHAHDTRPFENAAGHAVCATPG